MYCTALAAAPHGLFGGTACEAALVPARAAAAGLLEAGAGAAAAAERLVARKGFAEAVDANVPAALLLAVVLVGESHRPDPDPVVAV